MNGGPTIKDFPGRAVEAHLRLYGRLPNEESYMSDANRLNEIGWAVKQMHNGSKVRRAGWNGKGMFLFLVPGSRFKVNRPPLLGLYPEGTEIDYHPHVDMKTAQGYVVPWLCSQADLLATDWEIATD